MRQINKQSMDKGIKPIFRVGLFLLTLTLGITIILFIGETPGLALADLSKAPVHTIATSADGNSLYAVLNGEADNGEAGLNGLYRSDDQGRTWRFIGRGPDVDINTLVAHPTNDAVLFAGSDGGPVATANNLWRSDDGGQNWHKFFLGLPAHPDGLIPAVTSLVVDPDQPEILYVGTDGQGVYRFNVGLDGYGYSLVGGVAFHDIQIRDLEVGSESRIYALTNDKLFTSHDGDTWQEIGLPPDAPLDLAVAIDRSQTVYLLTYSGAVYRSNDGEQYWRRIGGDWLTISDAVLQGTALAVSKHDADHAAVSTAYLMNERLVAGTIYETSDAGQNWAKVADANGVTTHLAISNDAVYAAAADGLVRYGEPVEPGFGDIIFANLDKLTSLTAFQLFILLFTVGLAGLILLGRMEWILLMNRR